MQSSKLQFKNHKFLKLKIGDVPLEEAHGGAGKRKMLLRHEFVESKHWEAITKGYLGMGKVFDWHTHDDADEVIIVLKGKGKYFCENEVIGFNADDIFITPAKIKHKIEAENDCEFYFIRVKI